jgi:endogenous inhibitor of DNA gyrase (YacG/DUF329 family)
MPSESPRFQTRSCPICCKPAQQETRPFCSRRCADIDLHRWFSGAYAIPAQEDADEDGAVTNERQPPDDAGS